MAVSSPTNENTSTFKEPSKFIEKNRVCLCIRREVKLLFTCVVTFFFLLPRNAKGEQRANLH